VFFLNTVYLDADNLVCVSHSVRCWAARLWMGKCWGALDYYAR